MPVSAAAYDWSVAGLPFISAAAPENPYERAYSRVLKDQIDNSNEPGDTSLEGWWVRSQTNWTAGAGYEWMEPISEEPIPSTFNWSYGVNPWHEGEICLHRQSTADSTVAGNEASNLLYLNGRVWFSVGAEVYSAPWDDTTTLTLVATMTTDVTTLTSAFGALVAGTGDGVYTVATGGITEQIYSSSAPAFVWFAKDRLFVAVGPNLYEVGDLDANGIDIGTLTPVGTSRDVNWVWTDVTSGPAGIYVAGHGNSGSTISLITLDTSTSVPTLTPPTVVAELPVPERVLGIDIYIGTYMLIRSTLGVRVGVVDTQGVTYGPLLKCGLLTGGFAFYDRFAYGTIADAGEDRSGIIRFDLSGLSNEQRIPFAMDVRVPVGDDRTVTDVVVVSEENLIFLGSNDTGSALFSSRPSSPFEPYGVLQSGWIRMGTTVPKVWSRFAMVRPSNSAGRVTAYLVDESETAHEIGFINSPDGKKTFNISDQHLSGERAAIRLVLTAIAELPPPVEPPPDPEPPDPPDPPGEDDRTWADLKANGTWQALIDGDETWESFGASGVPSRQSIASVQSGSNVTELEAWTLMATPAVPRNELLRIPLLCFDWELDNDGNQIGGEGTAITRYEELVAATSTGLVVDLVDLNNDRTYAVAVEDLAFSQVAAPDRGEGFGGVVSLTGKIL